MKEWQAGFHNRAERLTERLWQMGIRHPAVLIAMRNIPRQHFVEPHLRAHAYDEMSLPIGCEQHLDRPYVVARTTELLLGNDPNRVPRRVLEIGTGNGYQTAVLFATGVQELYSIECFPNLHQQAKYFLDKLGLLKYIRTFQGNGAWGLQEVAPFDGIILTTAVNQIPLPLLQQLAIGGSLVVPLNDGKEQFIWLIEKTETGFLETCVEACEDLSQFEIE